MLRILKWPLQKVKTPNLKHREHAKLILENGVKITLTSDTLTPACSAAVCVSSGSWKDTPKHQGIAHFLEHMVSHINQGTRSFPKENDYEQFIYDNGGSFNAYTSSDHSLYYFDGVNPSSLNAALHRLSCFFHEPLFQDSSSDRERNAVDQEYKMNIEQDGWRKHHVFKQLARKDHPFSMFNTGNLHTMKLIDVEYLKKWHAANYTSDLLNVAILGRESIPELTEMATRLFSNIPRGLIKSINHDNIFPDDLKGKIIRIEPKMDIKEISIVWEIPRCNIETKPASQLGYIIGQETSNSLLSKLKKLHFVDSLSAGEMEIGQNNVWFEISVTLTELGLKNWITVSSLIFQYLSDLKKRDVPIHVFNDINQMKRINHDYQQRNTSIVSKYAEMMRNEDIETFPEKSLFIKRFDPDGIKTLINLLVPDSALLTLVSKPLDEDSLQDWLTEKWMGARYYVRSTTSNEFKEFNKSGSNNAQFPAPNRYIPKNLQVLEKTTSTVPLKLHDSENGVVYYNKDNEYLIPRCLLKFRISIPSINASDAKSLALSSLYMSFIDERINEMASEASFAGLNVNVSISDSQKVQVSVSGYSEMINLVLKDVICSVKNPLLGVEEFVVFKDRLERKLINSFKNSPIRQGYEILGDKLMKEYSTSVQILEALKPIDIDMLSLFIKDLYEESYIESFIGGNLTESEALDAWNLVKTTINSKKGNKSLVKKPIVNNLKLNIHSKELDVKGNSLIWVLESTTSGDLKNRIANQLLSRMIKEPFYSELRTRQQCGYIVQSDLFRKHDRLFLITMIQSNTVDPRDLLSRVELFFENFSRELKEDEAMIERFENIKKAMIASKSEPFSTLDENLKHYSDISFEDQDWNVRQETVEILKVYQFEELKEFSNQVLSRMNIQRMGILTTGNDLENVAFRYK